MSLPLVYWGPDGEQYNTYADPATGGEPRYRLGQQLVLRDGRKFRFARNGGSTLNQGDVQQAAANTANNVDMAVSAAVAVGATSVPVTLGGGTITQDDYMDGMLVSVGTTANGGGMAYAIAEHHSGVSSGTAWTVPLAAGVTVSLAMTTSNFVSAIRNPYRNIIQAPATATQVPVGVAVSAPTANQWCWVQTRGVAAVKQHGTLVLGNMTAIGVTAGSVDPISTTIATTITQDIMGWVSQVSGKTMSPVFLTIDG